MADKEKKLRKLLLNSRLKGRLKLVKTLEEVHIIIVQDPRYPGKNTFYNRRGYQTELDNGETFPEECVYFTIPTNPRNIRQITNSIIIKDPTSLDN